MASAPPFTHFSIKKRSTGRDGERWPSQSVSRPCDLSKTLPHIELRASRGPTEEDASKSHHYSVRTVSDLYSLRRKINLLSTPRPLMPTEITPPYVRARALAKYSCIIGRM